VRGTRLVMLSFKAECCYFAVKKRYSGVGSGCESKFFVKYKFIGSGTKRKYIFPIWQADLIHAFYLGMKSSFPAKRKGLTEWKVKSEDQVQDILMKLFFWKVVFTEWKEMC
jgi:hypothetical protein